MHTIAFYKRVSALILNASLLVAIIVPVSVSAAGNVTFEFRPHCEGEDLIENKFGGPSPDVKGMTALSEGTCRTFEVRDPSLLQTPVFKVGDTVDIDIMVNNPSGSSIKRFRAWVAFDSTILEGIDVTTSTLFPVTTPGESDFIADEGLLKVSGSTTSAVAAPRFSVARVRFRILKDTMEGTPLIFTETTGDVQAKTGVFENESPNEQNILSSTFGSLFVRLTGAPPTEQPPITNTDIPKLPNTPHDAAISSAQSVSFSSSTAATSLNASSVASTTSTLTQKAFSLLQILGLRVTTEGSSVFLVWDILPSSELAGYNVYYGTVSGRYIQRRSVEKGANSLTLRALPVGTTYYFAVRGYNSANEETTFSQEVGVSVGNPKTSTAPLSANSIPTKTPETGGQVAGETGVTSSLLVLILSCAIVGTMIAMHRQYRTSSFS